MWLLFLSEALLVVWRCDLRALVSILDTWTAFTGLQVLVAVTLIAGSAAWLFGKSLPPSDARRILGHLDFHRHPVVFVAVQVPLFLGLIGLTEIIVQGGDRYLDHFLRYATAWSLAALATLGLSFVALLPRSWQLRLLQGSFESLCAMSIAGAIVCVGFLTHPFWGLLNQSTLWGVWKLLSLAYTDCLYQPEQALVGTASFTAEVACPCGGAEGIGSILVFLGVYLWLFRHTLRFPAAFVLLPLGVSLMWMSNVVRITTLIILATVNLPGVDAEGFHAQAGWFLFIGVALSLVVLARKSSFFNSTGAPLVSSPRTVGAAGAAFLTPLLAIVAVMMLSRIFAPDFDWLYPVRVIVAGILLWYWRGHYALLRWTWSWQAVAVGSGVFVMWIAMEPASPASGAEVSAELALTESSRVMAFVWLLFRVVGSVITVPLAEELAFRGYLNRRLITPDFESLPPGRFTWYSCLISSLLFGLVHDRWLAGTLAGFAYALALYRRGELTDAVQAHAITNALLAAYVLATGSWSLWVA